MNESSLALDFDNLRNSIAPFRLGHPFDKGVFVRDYVRVRADQSVSNVHMLFFRFRPPLPRRERIEVRVQIDGPLILAFSRKGRRYQTYKC